MMTAAALRISTQQWSSSTIASSLTQKAQVLVLVPGGSASTFSAMAFPGLRRCFSTPAGAALNRQFAITPNHRLLPTREEIWKRNFSRLYARRMLELVALAAAHKRFMVEMEAAIDRPANWKEWERRDWTDDLMASLGSTKLERFWVSARRIFSLSVLAAPMVLLYPFAKISDTAQKWSWDYALWGIEQAGPTLIKLTQWATTRQDLFSPEFCLHFGKLRDETIGHSFEDTMRILKEELGENHAQWLDMETKPIGSGCIAQVYRGTLREGTSKYPKGTEIALKIQHPGIWGKVCADFYLLAKIADWLESLPRLNLKYLSLADTVRQFRDIMLPQLDLRIEAKNLKRFNVDFSGDDDVTFPHPLDELTTTRVLTETFCHGTPIMEYTKAPVEMRRQVALIGLTTTLNMIFLKDFIHGDLHPGNILVSEKPDGKPQLHFLDCGLVVEVGPHQHANMIKILGALTRKDGVMAGQLMVDTSSGSQASQLDVDMFINGIVRICKLDDDNNFIECVGDYIADICFLACRHKVKLEATFINAALAVEIMEGIASALYPDMHVQPIALPLIVKAEVMHRLPKIW